MKRFPFEKAESEIASVTTTQISEPLPPIQHRSGPPQKLPPRPFPPRTPPKPLSPITRPVSVPERFPGGTAASIPVKESIETPEIASPAAFQLPEDPERVEHLPATPPDVVPVDVPAKAGPSPVQPVERLPESKIEPLPAVLRQIPSDPAQPSRVEHAESVPPPVIGQARPELPELPPLPAVEHRDTSPPEIDVEALLAEHAREEPVSFFRLEGEPLLSEMGK